MTALDRDEAGKPAALGATAESGASEPATEASPAAVLAVEDLHVTFRSRHGHAPAHAVDGVPLALAPGEVLALVGES